MCNEINDVKNVLRPNKSTGNVGDVGATLVVSPSEGKGGWGGDGQVEASEAVDQKQDKFKSTSDWLGQPHQKNNVKSAAKKNNQTLPTDAFVVPKKVYAGRKAPLPQGFQISDRVRAWAARAGYTHTLNQRFEDFVLKAEMHGYRYANWDAAFMTACRMDWAKLGPPNTKKQVAL